jgi:hypothetical protein
LETNGPPTASDLRFGFAPFLGSRGPRRADHHARMATKYPANKPLLRRGRDSNPRWTVRPTTVFETITGAARNVPLCRPFLKRHVGVCDRVAIGRGVSGVSGVPTRARPEVSLRVAGHLGPCRPAYTCRSITDPITARSAWNTTSNDRRSVPAERPTVIGARKRRSRCHSFSVLRRDRIRGEARLSRVAPRLRRGERKATRIAHQKERSSA